MLCQSIENNDNIKNKIKIRESIHLHRKLFDNYD